MCEVVMGANRKAILANSKALHTEKDGSYYQAMLSTSADLAARLQVAFERTKMSQAEFARACGASRQGVRSWLTTGRIAKGKLVTFSQVTGVSIEELLGQGPPAPAAPAAPMFPAYRSAGAHPAEDATRGPWPFSSFTRYEFLALPPEDRGIAEGFVRGLIAASHRKNNGTTGGA